MRSNESGTHAVVQRTLRPGETIVMPPGWWHTTRMSEPSISVTWDCVLVTDCGSVVADTDSVSSTGSKAQAKSRSTQGRQSLQARCGHAARGR